MIKTFSTLGAPVGFFNGQDALFLESIVRESLPCRDGAVLLRLWLWWLRLLLLLFVLQVHSLMSSQGGGVIESLATVTAGVTLSL